MTILLTKIVKAAEYKALGKRNTEITIEQLKILLTPLKWQGYKKMIIRKAYMMKSLEEWEEWGLLVEEKEVTILVAKEEVEKRKDDKYNNINLDNESVKYTEMSS